MNSRASLQRRHLLGALGASLLPGLSLATHHRPRIAALDWALGETLLAIGHAPVALVAAADWPRFVVEPALPSGVTDLGLQQEINLELLAALRPDLIVTSPFVPDIDALLTRIAPTTRLSIFEPSDEPLAHPRQLTVSLARLAGQASAARGLLDEADALFERLRARLAVIAPPPVLVMNFIDPRHVRVYAGNGLFQNTLAQLGVANAWRGTTGYWGFATVGIERLAGTGDAHLIVIPPLPGDVASQIARSPLWTRLPAVREGRVTVLPPVFMFGALPAAMRFSRLLTEALEGHAA